MKNSIKINPKPVVVLLAGMLTFGTVHAQNVTIPDPVFSTYLVNNAAVNTNGDGFIQVSEANAFSGAINVSGLGISDLTGIEEFINLTGLNCSGNLLTMLDVSNSYYLSDLQCANNQLTSLDVYYNPSLTKVYCRNNSITYLDFYYSPYIDTVDCAHNQLYSIDISMNNALRYLDCSFNQMTDLNASDNFLLSYLACNDNYFTSLNIQNGNNANLNFFDAINNSSGLCVQVDDIALMNSNWNYAIDLDANYSTNCAVCNIYIPDANFKAVLLADILINTNANTEIECAEALAYAGIIDVSYENIQNLTGIEAFINITELYINNNLLSSVDVSGNTALVILECSSNLLVNLDVTNLILLEELWCYNNQLISVDIFSNVLLNSFGAWTNQLIAVDASNNAAMVDFDCYNNQLITLNIQNGNNTNLTTFDAYSNPDLACIQVDDVAYMNTTWGSNIDPTASFSLACACVVNIPDANFKAALLNDLSINTNGNTEIECAEADVYSGNIDVENLGIFDLTGIEAFINLQQLECNTNQLTTLDLGSNYALQYVNAQANQLSSIILPSGSNLSEVVVAENQLTNITVGSNSYLTYLDCRANNLSNLNVQSNTYLYYLFCDYNQLTSLDCSNNYNLIQLNCNDNQLSYLNIQNGNNSNLTSFNALNNPDLTCVQVDSVAYMISNWSGLVDNTANFNLSCGACTVTIPDANFKTALLNNVAINTNGNTEIECAEAAAYTGYLNVSSFNISNLAGIEAFTAIDSLNCANNQLTTLDVTNNTGLVFIQTFGNQLNSINVTGLTSLKVLYCYTNQLTSLDLSTTTALEVLNCNVNQLTSLNTGANTALTYLGCSNNFLGSLNVSTNSLLTLLSCSNNTITSLNVQFNPLITTLNCDQNLLVYLDLSGLSQLNNLAVNDNVLTYLNLQNGNNSNLVDFEANNNPGLTCVQVDDIVFMNSNFSGAIDAPAAYSLSCACTVTIPDANFKAALVSNTAINTNGNSEIECSEAAMYADTIYVSNMGITSLTGIEAFTAITGLVCNLNSLSSINLASNTALTFLHCYDNLLTSLNVNNNTALVNLWCSNNQLDYIDVSNNLLLEGFACFNNNFTSLDVSNNTLLKDFRCSVNNLTSIDVSANLQLELLYCGNNLLTALDVSTNLLLEALDCGPNFLTSIDLSNNTSLTTLEAGNNQLVILDLSNNTAMTSIYVNMNALVTLFINNGNNTNLTAFSAVNNPGLTCIQVDDVAYMNTNWASAKDIIASYNTSCAFICPAIPLAFSASNTDLTTVPMNAVFANTTPGLSNYTFVWYFGDGTLLESNAATVNHTYNFNGIYSVSLVAYNNSTGCSDTLYNANYISCSASGGMSCAHTVTLNPGGLVNACVGSLVPLNGNTSALNATYQWNRNGVIVGGASQDSYLASANGNYALTVFDSDGCPKTSTAVQLNYSLQSSIAPVITATGPVGTCGNINVTLTAGGSFANYLWSSGQNTSSITVTQGGSYTVTGQSPACDAVSLPYSIDGSAAPVPPICMVTVDEADNKNVVIWEKPVSVAIDSFLVLREDIGNAGIYTILSTQSYVDLSEFKDMSSDANARAYRYKLAVKDTCSGITIPSDAQRSMHLDVAQGNSILSRQLTWNVYQGQPQAFTQYLIYRETVPGSLNLVLIDSVPSTQTWYYDNTLSSIADTARAYKIGYRVSTACVSTRAQNDICSSNVTANERPVIDGVTTHAASFLWSMYPNPTKGIFTIHISSGNKYQLRVVNLIGEELYQQQITTNQNTVDLSGLSNGIYFVSLNDGINTFAKRLVIAK